MIDFHDLLNSVNRLFEKAMDWKWFPRTPLFWNDYHATYPDLVAFEKVYPQIRKEVEAFLKESQKITDVKDLAGKYTAGGIHTIEWKSYLIKLGKFVEANCRHCPETAKALAQVPRVHVAFFFDSLSRPIHQTALWLLQRIPTVPPGYYYSETK